MSYACLITGIGAIIGVVTFLALLGFAGWMFFRCRRGAMVCNGPEASIRTLLVNMEQYSPPDDGPHLL